MIIPYRFNLYGLALHVNNFNLIILHVNVLIVRKK